MLMSTALGLFLAFWSILYLIDYYLRASSHKLYLDFVEKTGLIVSPFQVRWYTSRFQLALTGCRFLRLPRVRRFLDFWFGAGVLLAGISMLVMLLYLTQILYAEVYRTVWYKSDGVVGAIDGVPGSDLGGPGGVDQQGSSSSSAGSSAASSSDSATIIPIVPGVNLPWEHFPLFLFILVLCGVFHELGHAVAALNDNVGVNGFGVFLLAIYPGAFTEIENEGLDSVSPYRKLKIYSGGIWHNFALVIVGLTILYTLPHTLSPAYMTNKGVVVRSVNEKSGLAGVAGLRPGHVIYGINYCKVYNQESWINCLARLTKTHYGYCVPRKEVVNSRSQRVANVFGELHCCGANSTQTHLCFYYKGGSSLLPEMDPNNLAQQHHLHQDDHSTTTPSKQHQHSHDDPQNKKKVIPDTNNDNNKLHQHSDNKEAAAATKKENQSGVGITNTGSQLRQVQLVDSNDPNNNNGERKQERQQYSNDNKQQQQKLDNIFEYSCLPARYVTDHYVCNNSLPCHPRTTCIYPALFNSTKLLRFFVANMSKPVLFIGFPAEVAQMVTVSSYVPRVPNFAPIWLPVVIELFCKYLYTFSLGLALFNAVPCYSLDGQYILSAFLQRYRKWGRRRLNLVYNALMGYGTLLLLSNVILALYKFFRPFLSNT